MEINEKVEYSFLESEEEDNNGAQKEANLREIPIYKGIETSYYNYTKNSGKLYDDKKEIENSGQPPKKEKVGVKEEEKKKIEEEVEKVKVKSSFDYPIYEKLIIKNYGKSGNFFSSDLFSDDDNKGFHLINILAGEIFSKIDEMESVVYSYSSEFGLNRNTGEHNKNLALHCDTLASLFFHLKNKFMLESDNIEIRRKKAEALKIFCGKCDVLIGKYCPIVRSNNWNDWTDEKLKGLFKNPNKDNTKLFPKLQEEFFIDLSEIEVKRHIANYIKEFTGSSIIDENYDFGNFDNRINDFLNNSNIKLEELSKKLKTKLIDNFLSNLDSEPLINNFLSNPDLKPEEEKSIINNLLSNTNLKPEDQLIIRNFQNNPNIELEKLLELEKFSDQDKNFKEGLRCEILKEIIKKTDSLIKKKQEELKQREEEEGKNKIQFQQEEPKIIQGGNETIEDLEKATIPIISTNNIKTIISDGKDSGKEDIAIPLDVLSVDTQSIAPTKNFSDFIYSIDILNGYTEKLKKDFDESEKKVRIKKHRFLELTGKKPEGQFEYLEITCDAEKKATQTVFSFKQPNFYNKPQNEQLDEVSKRYEDPLKSVNECKLSITRQDGKVALSFYNIGEKKASAYIAFGNFFVKFFPTEKNTISYDKRLYRYDRKNNEYVVLSQEELNKIDKEIFSKIKQTKFIIKKFDTIQNQTDFKEFPETSIEISKTLVTEKELTKLEGNETKALINIEQSSNDGHLTRETTQKIKECLEKEEQKGDKQQDSLTFIIRIRNKETYALEVKKENFRKFINLNYDLEIKQYDKKPINFINKIKNIGQLDGNKIIDETLSDNLILHNFAIELGEPYKFILDELRKLNDFNIKEILENQTEMDNFIKKNSFDNGKKTYLDEFRSFYDSIKTDCDIKFREKGILEFHSNNKNSNSITEQFFSIKSCCIKNKIAGKIGAEEEIKSPPSTQVKANSCCSLGCIGTVFKSIPFCR